MEDAITEHNCSELDLGHSLAWRERWEAATAKEATVRALISG